MTINITPEIEDAYRQFLAEQVGSFVGGQLIYRRDTAPYSTMRFSGLVDFAAGHQAARAALAVPAVQPVRMLTGHERWEAYENCRDDESDVEALQRKFCEVNGLTIKEDKHHG